MNGTNNLLELEQLRSDLIGKTLSSSSNNLRMYLYYGYFERILSLNNPNLEEAFLKEFLDDYLACVIRFQVWGIEPPISNKILQQLEQVASLNISSGIRIQLDNEIKRITGQLERLSLVLEGKEPPSDETHRALFPLLDNEAPEGYYGIIESITVRINKTSHSDKFIIIPSEKEIEKKIQDQCRKSWGLALRLSGEYISKPYKHHEVIIIFDRKEGFYEGNSLGIAITLCFLEQILNFYNPAYIIKIKEESTFTGGVSDTGEIYPVGEEIIKRKTSAVFFSETGTFVFPKKEELYAQSALSQLQKRYPERKVKLVPVEDIRDVLNRRDVVDIRKQKLAIRTGKFVKRNWVSTTVAIILSLLFTYLFVFDFDNNPVFLSPDNGTLYVKNKNGRVLWTKHTHFDSDSLGIDSGDPYMKIIDINYDGRNEVILVEDFDQKLKVVKNAPQIVCYNSDGDSILWTYLFEDSVQYEGGIIPKDYGIRIIDTLTFEGEKSLFLTSSSINQFSSAIYRISLLSGTRLSGTFWSSGHVLYAYISKNRNQYSIVGSGYDNGYNDVVLFQYDIDTTTRVRPSLHHHLIKGPAIAKMEDYLRFPKTDYDTIIKTKRPLVLNCYKKEDKLKIVMGDAQNPKLVEFSYAISDDFKDIEIVLADNFIVRRDYFVNQGKLNHPLTNTDEYINVLKNNILYWKDGKWVHRKDLD